MMDETKNVFWGLIVKPGKRYETEVQEPFRLVVINLVLALRDQFYFSKIVLLQQDICLY